MSLSLSVCLSISLSLSLSLCFCIDYLQINDVIKETQYPVFEKDPDMH